jgi:hypothetical protein
LCLSWQKHLSLTDDGFSLPQEPHLIHIYTTSSPCNSVIRTIYAGAPQFSPALALSPDRMVGGKRPDYAYAYAIT